LVLDVVVGAVSVAVVDAASVAEQQTHIDS